MMRKVGSALSLAALVLTATTVVAQPAPLTVPQLPSQRGQASQRIGLTDVSIDYSRPSVGGRKVWGSLVPWGQVWRAGANLNTVLSFSTEVNVGGRKLAPGKYGVQVIPVESGDWTFILSTVSTAWGSEAYDPKEDAVRVSVKPQTMADPWETLSFTFDEPKRDSVLCTLRWEKVKVSLPIAVDTNAVVVDSMRKELRGQPRFGWQGWQQAASFCANSKVNVEEALTWSDESIKRNENFTNLRTKATLLELKGDTAAAAAMKEKAFKTAATEADVNLAGYDLLGARKVDEAIVVFQKNTKDFPKSWNAHDSLAEALETKGDKKAALAMYQKALSLEPPADQKKRLEATISKLKG